MSWMSGALRGGIAMLGYRASIIYVPGGIDSRAPLLLCGRPSFSCKPFGSKQESALLEVWLGVQRLSFFLSFTPRLVCQPLRVVCVCVCICVCVYVCACVCVCACVHAGGVRARVCARVC